MQHVKVESCFVEACKISLSTEIAPVIYPQWRSIPGRGEEASKGARLEVLLGTEKAVEDFMVDVDWELQSVDDPERYIRTYHDYAYISQDRKDWRMLAAFDVNGSVTSYKIPLKAGKNYFTHYPAYGLAELEADLEGWESRGFAVTNYGQSQKGRPLYCVNPRSPVDERPTLGVIARNHAYETTGSFCCRGIVDFLCSGEDIATYLLENFNIYILPMTNVDGVEDGMSRYTAPDGADLNRYITRDDAAHKALVAFLDQIKPDTLLNYHNWQSKFYDGMWCYDKFYEEDIRNYMKDLYKDGKKLNCWTVKGNTPVFEFEKCSMQDYAESKYGTKSVTYEFPWFGRTTQRMEEIGKISFLAAALARIREIIENRQA